MSDQNAPRGIPSRLARKAAGPTRGLGSGFAANQRLAGAADPEAAAKAASLPEDEAREQAQAEEKVVENLTSKIGELVDATTQGWEPTLDDLAPARRPKTTEAWQAFFEAQTPAIILECYEELQAAIEASIDAETDALAQAQQQRHLMDQFAIGPDHHLYQPLTDTDRRVRIEAQLEPLDIADLIFNGYVRQKVPLQKNLNITLRSISTTHGMWVEWYANDRAAKEEGTITYRDRLVGIMHLAASLDQVNGKATGPDLSEFIEESQRELFIDGLKKRMAFVGRLPQEITNDFIVQNIWFGGRIRKCLAGNQMEKVGNS